MRFVWFWTFWYWSKEGYRSGTLLRGPLHGIGGHWDEWFHHEASEEDRRAIQEAGRTESNQRLFVNWLRRHWAREAGWESNRIVPRFVLRQLSQLAPFDKWAELEKYQRGYGRRGVSAIVLAEDSPGEPEDVRCLEAVALPVDAEGEPPSIVPEGFQADESELKTTLGAVFNLLRGKGLLVLLSWWVLIGRRPYPRPMKAALGMAWLAVGGLILYLFTGPDPGGRLFILTLSLAGLWGCLVIISCMVTGMTCFAAWREGRRLARRLDRSRVRLRMESGLTLKGGSAGLAFCLNALYSLHRAEPRGACRSWLWSSFFRRMRSDAASWAATGAVTARSQITPVVVEPKLRACLQHPGIDRVLTPRQRGTGRRAIDRLAESLAVPSSPQAAPRRPAMAAVRLGFAAEAGRLETRTSSHVAQPVLIIGGLWSRWQMLMNLFAISLSLVTLLALPDIRCILLPPPAPLVVPPSSPSPYFLWVSLETEFPTYFHAVLESDFWSNRRVGVTGPEGPGSVPRAEIRLHRLAKPAAHDVESGNVWIERRRRFLTREFAPGDRVGRYSFAYLSHLGHE